ncbi:phage BR0599 family protein, partial [Hoeflea sp.]|uniref:phage BR0599 family protein n=1 Tax=Hoeflea sp. TaxID=1940281 RepID=UPI0031B80CEE
MVVRARSGLSPHPMVRARSGPTRVSRHGLFLWHLITFTSGANEGASMEVKAHGSGGAFELWRAMARDIA